MEKAIETEVGIIGNASYGKTNIVKEYFKAT